MTITDRIYASVQQLSAVHQAEVLDFIEFILKRYKSTRTPEDASWSEESLTSALRGMEDEDVPHYGTADLKVSFS